MLLRIIGGQLHKSL